MEMLDIIKSMQPLWNEWYIEDALGEGSVGKVYRLRNKSTEEYSALKIITISSGIGNYKYARIQGMDEECMKYFFESILEETMNEIHIMQELGFCENVVKCINYSTHRLDNSGWLVLIQLELLESFIKRMLNSIMQPKDVCKLGIDVCKALEACQKIGIVHRDIKPENLFYNKYTDEYKVGDFGFAHYLQRPTEEKGRAGTLTHMSPEVYGGMAADYDADLYAIGMILYRLLNDNRIPFLPAYPEKFTPWERDRAMLTRLRGENPMYPISYFYACDLSVNETNLGLKFLDKDRELLKRLCFIATKAIQANKKERFRSAKEMRIALEEIQEQL